MLFCIAIGARISHTHTPLVYSVFSYGSLARKELVDAGLFVVPTRNMVKETIAGDRKLRPSEECTFPVYATKETVKVPTVDVQKAN